MAHYFHWQRIHQPGKNEYECAAIKHSASTKTDLFLPAAVDREYLNGNGKMRKRERGKEKEQMKKMQSRDLFGD